jgi:hypothetical protein
MEGEEKKWPASGRRRIPIQLRILRINASDIDIQTLLISPLERGSGSRGWEGEAQLTGLFTQML